MLITPENVLELLYEYNIHITGVLHIGAHECEEKSFYNDYFKLNDDTIIWVDGNKDKVNFMKNKGIKNIYQAVLNDKEEDITFNITDNTQASSILELNHDKGYYNYINIINKISCKSLTLPGFITRNLIDITKLNFWNLDIQGSEYNVLFGSQDLLKSCDAIYTEVNSDHVYKQCGLISDIDNLLEPHGFVRVYTEWTSSNWGDALYIRVIKK
jgi:FkbM family methyltransferase